MEVSGVHSGYDETAADVINELEAQDKFIESMKLSFDNLAKKETSLLEVSRTSFMKKCHL